MTDMVIAQCPKCGQQYYSWTEEDALEKFKGHVCPRDMAEDELELSSDNAINVFQRANTLKRGK